MRAALRYDDAFHCGVTTHTSLPRPSINRQQILVGATSAIRLAVLIVAQTRAPFTDGFGEHADDATVQTGDLARRQGIGRS
jgi:hypothetical protein